ncbi:MAG: DUF3987 domain-containing protein, partial [Gemmataceae bacterium]|nr:DUF3987 domain-containing protein [Gemmataceae bacterium]
ASRCTPPMSDAEVAKTVETLARKHQGTAAAAQQSDPVDTVALPPETPWPQLDEAALHGPVGELVRLVEPASEADPAGLLLSALVALGNCIGRIPHFLVEGNAHHVNLFAVLVGESARARKGTSMGRIMSLFDMIDADWKSHRVVSGLSSGEGLIWVVRDPIEGIEATKDKNGSGTHQIVVKDPGVQDKRLLVNESEFAQALRVLRREGNTLSPIIRQAWDEGNMKALTKNSPAQATDAHVSILGHITRPELAKYLDDTDVFNGFANRFLWAAVRRSKLLPDGGQGVDLQPLKESLAKTVAAAKQIAAMSRNPEARSLWWSVYPELTGERPGLYGAVTGRGEAQVLRLSMLYALLDGTAIIGMHHLQAALAVWRYCDASARLIFKQEDESSDPLEKSLLGVIRQQPGVNRKGLHKALGGHVAAAQMVQALARLRDKGLVRMEVVPTAGRPGECWYPRERTTQVVLTPFQSTSAPASQEIDPEVPSVAVSEALPASRAGQDGSLARIPITPITSLAELFAAVKAINGRLCWQGDRIGVDAGSVVVPLEILAGIDMLEADLLPFMPPRPAPTPPTGKDDEGVEVDENDPFIQALRSADDQP